MTPATSKVAHVEVSLSDVDVVTGVLEAAIRLQKALDATDCARSELRVALKALGAKAAENQ